ncbi:MAG: hypothetical protein J0L82_18425 [Deltaproteobacteria bacterium]|nr:hypothetical protein [Deltaproteobacteria bacterium]
MKKCPECDSSEEGEELQISVEHDVKTPWSNILKAVRCSGCGHLIPAHIWERWNGLTFKQAKLEWIDIYRSKTSRQRQAAIEYVDEGGRPIDPDSIDLDKVTFADEFGRPCDENGELILDFVSELDAVEIGENLLRAGKLNDVIGHCTRYVEIYSVPTFWKLLGVAHGSLGDPTSARFSFLSALNLDSSDAVSLGNYVTACFDAGDKKSALEAIERFFENIGDDGKQIILGALLEAIKSGLVAKHDLPPAILRLLREVE